MLTVLDQSVYFNTMTDLTQST